MNLAHLKQALETQTISIDELEKAIEARCRCGWVIRYHLPDEEYNQYLYIEKDYGFGWGYDDYWYTTVFENYEDAEAIASLLYEDLPYALSVEYNNYLKIEKEMKTRLQEMRHNQMILSKIVNYFKHKDTSC